MMRSTNICEAKKREGHNCYPTEKNDQKREKGGEKWMFTSRNLGEHFGYEGK